MFINEILENAIKINASDVHIKAGSPVVYRVHGDLIRVNDNEISSGDSSRIADSILNQQQKEIFSRKRSIDISYSVTELGRFRCNMYFQRGTVVMAFRVIPWEIPSIEALTLPSVLKKISLEARGLVIVVGTTGSGKSTALATMIDYINSNKKCNIITIEDPIEYLHSDKNSIVSQREIGADAESFQAALRESLRQDPDVILVGEMRDFETMQTAIIAAETGHLVFSTLHTTDTSETINRIITVFPPHQEKQIRMQLASTLKAIISLRLITKSNGKGLVPAVEILINTGTVKDYIIDPEKTRLIPELIENGKVIYGMQTFDQSLLDLYNDGLIKYQDAVSIATNPNDFALKVKGIQSTSDLSKEDEKNLPNNEIDIERFDK